MPETSVRWFDREDPIYLQPEDDRITQRDALMKALLTGRPLLNADGSAPDLRDIAADLGLEVGEDAS
jgi:hypothetical protein